MRSFEIRCPLSAPIRSAATLSAATLSLSTLVLLGAAAIPAAAQAGPGIIRGSAPNAAFAGQTPWGMHIYRLASDRAGEFTCALAAGTPADVDVTIGTYDQVNGTFTPTDEAAAFNSPMFEVSLALEPGLGRYAVFTRGGPAGPASVWFGARAKAGTPFGAPVEIAGFGPGAGAYALGYVDGTLKLFYPDGPLATTGPDKVVMQDLDVSDPSAPTVTGQPETVATLGSSGLVMFDMSTIDGPNGEVRGLVITEVAGSGPSARPRQVLKAGLDPNHPVSVIVELPPDCGAAPCAAIRGSFAGGRCLFTGSWAGPPVLLDVAAAWILGDRVKPGETADIFGATASSQNSAETFVFASIREAPALPMPFVGVGELGLDTTILVFAGLMKHETADQRGHLPIPVPNDPRARGRVAVQGLSFDPNAQTYAFTNTAWVVIE